MSANFLYNTIRLKYMLSDRSKIILKAIIKEYVATAQPVSSGLLVEKYNFDISPATVRNEMTELEEAGYISQPHTSAGRIPTKKAYLLEIEEIGANKAKPLRPGEKKILEDCFEPSEEGLKKVAKVVAELADTAVFFAFNKNSLYHTGLSNLFSQPEFKQLDSVYDASKVIDAMEDIIDGLFDSLEDGAVLLAGDNNPFGDFLGSALLRYRQGRQSGIFGILGPIRMDYARNLGIINFIEEKFKDK